MEARSVAQRIANLRMKLTFALKLKRSIQMAVCGGRTTDLGGSSAEGGSLYVQGLLIVLNHN